MVLSLKLGPEIQEEHALIKSLRVELEKSILTQE